MQVDEEQREHRLPVLAAESGGTGPPAQRPARQAVWIHGCSTIFLFPPWVWVQPEWWAGEPCGKSSAHGGGGWGGEAQVEGAAALQGLCYWAPQP